MSISPCQNNTVTVPDSTHGGLDQRLNLQQQAIIGGNSEFEDHAIIELKSLSSNVAPDPSSVKSITYLADTGKMPWTDNMASDDGHILVLCYYYYKLWQSSLYLHMQETHFEIQQVHQSAYFSVAKKTAQITFLDHQILECDCNGREYTNIDHDITLRIPKGAVPEGKKVHFEVGVAMYGPFIFPENTQPISPILWLCLLEEDVELKKPFQVIVPHYLTGLSKERIEHHEVEFSKANHNDYTFIDNQISYVFQHCGSKPPLATSSYRNYGVLISKHCCFYCLLASKTPELATDAGYCLVRIESCISPQRNEFNFAGIYFLETCLRVSKLNADYSINNFYV